MHLHQMAHAGSLRNVATVSSCTVLERCAIIIEFNKLITFGAGESPFTGPTVYTAFTISKFRKQSNDWVLSFTRFCSWTKWNQTINWTIWIGKTHTKPLRALSIVNYLSFRKLSDHCWRFTSHNFQEFLDKFKNQFTTKRCLNKLQ